MSDINILLSRSAVDLLDKLIDNANGYDDSKDGSIVNFERRTTRRQLVWDRSAFVEMLIYECAESVLGIIQDEE